MLKKWGFIVVLIAVVSASCSKYQKLLKSSDMDFKYTEALKYYDDEKYEKAMALFEELIPLFRGTDRAEKVYYCYNGEFHRGEWLDGIIDVLREDNVFKRITIKECLEIYF